MNLIPTLLIFLSGLLGGYALLPRRFYYVSELLTWDAAQSYCRLKYNDLAFVFSEEDLDKLKASIPSFIPYIWIGGFDLNSGSNSTVRDNTSAAAAITTTSSSDCVGIDTSSWKQMKQTSCLMTYPFYCSRYEGKRVLMQMKLTPDGNVNLSDPVLKGQMLAKINEKFNQLGFGDAVTIRWFTKQEMPTKIMQNNTCS